MASITFDRFEGGLDLRKGKSVSDANRLQVCTNAHVTTGRVIKSRPGTTLVATLEPGTKGLVASKGKLNTFYGTGTITHANTLFVPRKVDYGGRTVSRVHQAETFLGYIYASVEYTDGSIRHHYLSGGASLITNASCPHSASIAKAASKIWGIGSETVPFTKTVDATNWTAGTGASDASYLPTGLQQEGDTDATALAQYYSRLIVFFPNNIQIWLVDEDQALHAIRQVVNGVGTRWHGSVANVSGDVLMLHASGFRSVAIAEKTDSAVGVDVGSPIDTLVKPMVSDSITPVSLYYATEAQYWCAIGSTVWVYTFSRAQKISAWSKYTFPWTIDAMAELSGILYLRSGDNVYKLDAAASTDNGTAFTWTVELPFLDFKASGMLKQVHGMDAVLQGSCNVQFRFDPNSPSLITSAQSLSGDTRPNGLIPIGICCTNLAPVLSGTSACQIDLLTFYYDVLGVR